ncbi:hypothetical protein CVT26_006944 [Gymnopilus dilepis]|uniref:Uncharacterized protein n=1 Tax=Gymnopilus dilepis TaxID=231916 RepID=A0A409W6D2_9AGAR|nr:hypothetical protein CVT26_006944 [Gymnopilus dilepis]
MRDTPLRSLYRLHDVLCADEENYIMLEGHYFWMQSTWRLKDIPDPKDPNPLRYAILASLVEYMVEAYNWKISIGLRRGLKSLPRAVDEANRKDPNKPFEEAPEWAVKAPGVEEWISFLVDGSMRKYGNAFKKRRICANARQLENL